jgi:hypothetical protein
MAADGRLALADREGLAFPTVPLSCASSSGRICPIAEPECVDGAALRRRRPRRLDEYLRRASGEWTNVMSQLLQARQTPVRRARRLVPREGHRRTQDRGLS